MNIPNLACNCDSLKQIFFFNYNETSSKPSCFLFWSFHNISKHSKLLWTFYCITDSNKSSNQSFLSLLCNEWQLHYPHLPSTNHRYLDRIRKLMRTEVHCDHQRGIPEHYCQKPQDCIFFLNIYIILLLKKLNKNKFLQVINTIMLRMSQIKEPT